jgi:preprotein translocase subunit SecE
METKSAAMEQKPATGGIAAWPDAIRTYIEELRAEMRKVTWPNEKQVKATTLVVIISVFAFAAYFFVVDFIIGRGITQIFKVLAK